MNKLQKCLLVFGLSWMVCTANAVEVTGAGASFPAPIYAKWADAYLKVANSKINYQSIGSSGGVKQIKERTVDFGASDRPLEEKELAEAGLMQFPAVIGGVVPVINAQGIAPGQLKLTGEVLADIFLGKIVKWNDPAIAALNPGLKLPAQAIAVVRRADGSGTTFIFTNYLSKVSANWKSTVGEGASVKWPTGTGGKGNEGVAAFVSRLPGAIGYVEYAYAKQNKMAFTLLKNASGLFVAPDDVTFKAAADAADWSKSFNQILTEQSGKDVWPITGASFVLLHKSQTKPEQAKEILKFFDWAYKNGSQMAAELDYVPLPESVIKHIQAAWTQVTDGSGKSVYTRP